MSILKLVPLILYTVSLVNSLPIISKPLESNPDHLVWEALLAVDTRSTDPDKTRKIPKSIFITPNLNESKTPCPSGHRLGPDGKCYKTLNIDPLDILKTQIASLFNRSRTTEYDDYDYSEYGDSTESMSNSNGQYAVPLSLGFADEHRPAHSSYPHRVIKDDSRIVLNMDEEKYKQPFLVSTVDVTANGHKTFNIQTKRPTATDASTTIASTTESTTASASTTTRYAATESTTKQQSNDLDSATISSSTTADIPTVSASVQLHESTTEHIIASAENQSTFISTEFTKPEMDTVPNLQLNENQRIENETRDAKQGTETVSFDEDENVTLTSLQKETTNENSVETTSTIATKPKSIFGTTQRNDIISMSANLPSSVKPTDNLDEIVRAHRFSVQSETEKTVDVDLESTTLPDIEQLSPIPFNRTNADVELLALSHTKQNDEPLSDEPITFDRLQIEPLSDNETNRNTNNQSDEVTAMKIINDSQQDSNETRREEEDITTTEPVDQTIVSSSSASTSEIATDTFDVVDTYSPSASPNFENVAQLPEEIIPSYDIENSTAPFSSLQPNISDEHKIEIIKKSDQPTSTEDTDYVDDNRNLNARLKEELLFQGNNMALTKYDTINNSEDVVNFNTSELEYGINGSPQLGAMGDVTTEEAFNDDKRDEILSSENFYSIPSAISASTVYDDAVIIPATIDDSIAPIAAESSIYSKLMNSLQPQNGQQQQQQQPHTNNNDGAIFIQTGRSKDEADVYKIVAAAINDGESTTNNNKNTANYDSTSEIDKTIRLGKNCYLKNYLKHYYIMCT